MVSMSSMRVFWRDLRSNIILMKKHMEVSWNRGTPKSSILLGFFIVNYPAMGVPPLMDPSPYDQNCVVPLMTQPSLLVSRKVFTAHHGSSIEIPRCSMYGIFTYIYPKNCPNVGKHSIHGASGIWEVPVMFPLNQPWKKTSSSDEHVAPASAPEIEGSLLHTDGAAAIPRSGDELKFFGSLGLFSQTLLSCASHGWFHCGKWSSFKVNPIVNHPQNPS